MLTTAQRHARYAAQAGASPDTWTLRPGAQSRRAKHKTRHHFARPATRLARQSRREGLLARAAGTEARARAFWGARLGLKKTATGQ